MRIEYHVVWNGKGIIKKCKTRRTAVKHCLANGGLKSGAFRPDVPCAIIVVRWPN
jgi:hypothetical protein